MGFLQRASDAFRTGLAYPKRHTKTSRWTSEEWTQTDTAKAGEKEKWTMKLPYIRHL